MLRPLSFCSSDIFLSNFDFGLDAKTLSTHDGVRETGVCPNSKYRRENDCESEVGTLPHDAEGVADIIEWYLHDFISPMQL
jgi:hypothetical protein